MCSGLELSKKALQLEGTMVVGARRWDGAHRRSENAEKTKRGWSVGALGTGMERRQAVGPREGRRTLGRADPSRGMTSSQIQQTRP